MGPEAHSLQALKGCRRCWRPGGKARFQSHWQRVCCLDVRAGRNQTWSLTAAQTETFLSLHFPCFPSILTDQDSLLQ